MHEMYRDFVEGNFTPNIEVHKRADNGHYEATGCGLKVTHYDQDSAVNQLSAKINDGILKGEIHPGTI